MATTRITEGKKKGEIECGDRVTVAWEYRGGVQLDTVRNNSQFVLYNVSSVHSTILSRFSLISHTSAVNLLETLGGKLLQRKQKKVATRIRPTTSSKWWQEWNTHLNMSCRVCDCNSNISRVVIIISPWHVTVMTIKAVPSIFMSGVRFRIRLSGIFPNTLAIYFDGWLVGWLFLPLYTTTQHYNTDTDTDTHNTQSTSSYFSL
jgi:hypothetical protein